MSEEIEELEPSKRINTADKLADKLNKISVKFSEQLDNANALIVQGDELEEEATTIIKEVKELPVKEYRFDLDLLPQILNLENMMSDVKYIRETLQENSSLGRRLLKVISQELEFEPNADLLASYSQLSMTITDNMRLYLSCYKDISNILINIAKLTQSQTPKNVTVNNINIENQPKIQSTADLIKQLADLSNK